MQYQGIKTIITGKGKKDDNPFLAQEKEKALWRRKNRIVKEINYFKTKKEAQEYIQKHGEDNFGKIFADGKTMQYAVWYYRKY